MQLIELHILQSFPVTCLNRDDVGAPKSAVFGGCQRARVSSQSWKRAIRALAKEIDPGIFEGQRTRFVLRSIKERLLKQGKDENDAQLISIILADAMGKIDSVEKGNVKTLLYFSPMEMDAIVQEMLSHESLDELMSIILDQETSAKDKEKAEKEAKKIAEKAVKALSKAVKDAADISIFGRMVADDHSLMVEGAGLFSHALSTHSVSNDIDFFSAVDDLNKEDQGAGHIGTLEFNSACYYRYIGLNIDPLLKDETHLGHFSSEELKAVIRTFLRASILAVPEARKNSMLGHNPPDYVFGLNRKGQPLSLVNAFESPIKSHQGYMQPSIEALEAQWNKLDDLYGLGKDVNALSKLPPDNLDTLIDTLVSGV